MTGRFNNPLGSNTAFLVVSLLVLPTFLLGTGSASAQEAASPAIQIDLATATDQQLTAIAASWQQLSASQRRAVLVETTRRMDSKKRDRSVASRGQRRLTISVQRRYGRVRNGSVVVETRRLVQVSPGSVSAPQDPSTAQPPGQQLAEQFPQSPVTSTAPARVVSGKPARRVSFGAGFEARHGRDTAREKVQEDTPTPSP